MGTHDCQVGVIGIGHMGKGIASSYLRAGLTTGLYDINPTRIVERKGDARR